MVRIVGGSGGRVVEAGQGGGVVGVVRVAGVVRYEGGGARSEKD